MNKTCSKCGSTLSISEFGVDKRKKDGLNGWCKGCCRKASEAYRLRNPDRTRAAIKSWRDRNPEKTRAHGRAGKFRRFGLTEPEYEALFAKQRGVCAICGETWPGQDLDIDHSHVPGYENLSFEQKRACVRGLLCPLCNKGLGHAKDDPDRLEKAISYLAVYETRKPRA